MHVKTTYNFFTGQDVKKTQNQTQIIVAVVIGLLIVSGAVLLFLWGRASLAKDEMVLVETKARLSDPATLNRLQEIDRMNAQIESLSSYTSLAGIILERIHESEYASSENLDALLKVVPSSIQVESLDIQGPVWHMECKTNIFEDIAGMIHNIEESKQFSSAIIGNLQTDSEGIITFPIDFQLKGDISNEAE